MTTTPTPTSKLHLQLIFHSSTLAVHQKQHSNNCNATMSSTLLPFLYRTKTLQRAWQAQALTQLPRLLHSSAHHQARLPRDDAIPFEWENKEKSPTVSHEKEDEVASTITPSEAAIFKDIFDEIANGKMPKPKKRPEQPGPSSWASRTTEEIPNSASIGSVPRSIVEQARLTDFKDKFLQRYPKSLQTAAQVALKLYALEPEAQLPTKVNRNQMPALREAERLKRAERERYETARAKELQRVDAAMGKCTTDAALWKVMEQEVFCLPEKLGIVKSQDIAEKKGKRATQKSDEAKVPGGKKAEKETHVMDVHGPLYSQFLSTALNLLDTAFAQPSPYVFQILPRVKELGLSSYVLGVSAPFYSRLARVYWNRFGDANSALDVLQEMNSIGLGADKEVRDLLAQIRDHLHGCTWGAQGPFVMAMMESPPYDAALMQRLEDMDRSVKQSLGEETL